MFYGGVPERFKGSVLKTDDSVKGTKGSNPFPSSIVEKYSSGRRGAPAKGVGRETGARVRISPSPPLCFVKCTSKVM